MGITFKELSLVAELHYGKLPDVFRAQASDFFNALDQDGDGAVTLTELLDSNLEGKFGQDFLQHVFYSLDEEGRGHLEFRECLALYYLCMYSARVCVACERNIPHGLGYTCLRCWKDGQPPNNEFNVCLDCFSSHNYQHEHGPHHLLHDFVLFDNLLHSRTSSPTPSPLAPVRTVEQTVKQCVVCGDYHESTTRGFMSDVHMSKMRESTEFVCEWCFSYLCSKCGNLFRDSTTRAEPGKWLQRFVCPSCHQRNVTVDRYDASLRRLQEVLSGAELLRQCKTCEIKQRNGTLFWIVNGTNTASASASGSAAAAAAANSQQWASAPNLRSRSSSFDPGYGGSGSVNGSSRGGSSRASDPVNPMNMGEAPLPRVNAAPLNRPNMNQAATPFNRPNVNQAATPFNRPNVNQAATPFNRTNVNQAAAAAVRTVNRIVRVAGQNMFNVGGGAGGGGGGGGGGGNMFNVGGGGGIDSGGATFGMGSGGGGIDSGGGTFGMGSDGAGGGDMGGGDAGNAGIDASSFLASLGSLVGGSGGDAGGDAGNGGIDASSLLASFGSLASGIGSDGSGIIGDGSGDVSTW